MGYGFQDFIQKTVVTKDGAGQYLQDLNLVNSSRSTRRTVVLIEFKTLCGFFENIVQSFQMTSGPLPLFFAVHGVHLLVSFRHLSLQNSRPMSLLQHTLFNVTTLTS